jgi:hypothetical protein
VPGVRRNQPATKRWKNGKKGVLEMTMEEIREIAKKRGVKPGKMKKRDLVRAIQDAEGNDPCFDTGKKDVCGQDACLWRKDCQ